MDAPTGEILEETVSTVMATEAVAEVSTSPLLDLDGAVAKVPEKLRKEMEELLRADFSEVIRLKP